jgi:hypothetical protein
MNQNLILERGEWMFGITALPCSKVEIKWSILCTIFREKKKLPCGMSGYVTPDIISSHIHDIPKNPR